MASLTQLEQSALEAHPKPRKALRLLTQAQNRVTAQMLEHDPECLVPLLLLHLELQAEYASTAGTDSLLIHASRSRVRSLAQVYATDARQEMAPALAASALVELATDFARSGYLTSSLIVLREALSLDPQNTDVLLDLAYQYEHHRFHSEARDVLHRLLELDPRSDEGQLRLAMLLFQLDRDSEALALLRKLVDHARTDWVLAVAYQELAHHLLRAEHFDRAVNLLDQAIRRLPEVQRLRIELSYALDRVGRRQQAREVVAGLTPGSASASPRLNYRVPDRSERRRSRADILRHGTARLPLLTAAIQSVEEPK